MVVLERYEIPRILFSALVGDSQVDLTLENYDPNNVDRQHSSSDI